MQEQIAKLKAHFEKLQAEFAQEEQDAHQFSDKVAGYVPIEFQVDGIIRDYKEAVKETDGLTSLKPSVVTLLSKASELPSEANLAAAEKAVAGHLAELTKANGNNKDPKVKKHLDKFATAIKALEQRIKKHDRVKG